MLVLSEGKKLPDAPVSLWKDKKIIFLSQVSGAEKVSFEASISWVVPLNTRPRKINVCDRVDQLPLFPYNRG